MTATSFRQAWFGDYGISTNRIHAVRPENVETADGREPWGRTVCGRDHAHVSSRVWGERSATGGPYCERCLKVVEAEPVVEPVAAPSIPRFALFAGATYEPVGGWHDYHSGHETQPDAVEAARATRADPWNGFGWVHVVDLSNGAIVYEIEER